MALRYGFWILVLTSLLTGCASMRVVRLDTGEGAPLAYAPASWDASVRVDSDDFEEALARLVLEVPLSLRPSQAGLLVRAGTFAELEEAGERFGRVLGTEGTQVAILALTALLGQGMAGTSARLASRLELMPGFARAAALGEAQVGLRLAAVGEVTSVAVAADGTLVVALPATAVAMAASGGDGKHKHHIATIRNEVSTARGGPWTPRFRELFKKAGMTLGEAENIVPIGNHKGPHPERYHRLIHKRLDEAMTGCRNLAECRAALETVLKKLAREVATSGTELNSLVTRGAQR